MWGPRFQCKYSYTSVTIPTTARLPHPTPTVSSCCRLWSSSRGPGTSEPTSPTLRGAVAPTLKCGLGFRAELLTVLRTVFIPYPPLPLCSKMFLSVPKTFVLSMLVGQGLAGDPCRAIYKLPGKPHQIWSTRKYFWNRARTWSPRVTGAHVLTVTFIISMIKINKGSL